VTDLRYRGCGWPGMATVTYKDRDGITQQRQLTYEESWGEILQKYRQWRCYICPDHIGEFADIAVADAWHRPVSEHQPGRSIVIARSEYGLEMIHKAQKEGSLCLEATEPRILEQCMPWQIPLKAQLWGRLNTLKVMGVPVPDYQGFELYNLWRNKLKIKEKNKSFLGTIKRVFAKKLYKPIVLKPYTFEDTSS
jgi:coenzyme F420 hydrogenase subunit beta